jgi:hypothetical protein
LEHLLDQGEHRVLIEAITAQVSVLPAPQLELARIHRLRHVNASVGESPEMIFPQIRVHEVASFVPALKALLDERAKHPVLLVRAVEESANMTVLAENAPGASHGTAVRRHFDLLPRTQPWPSLVERTACLEVELTQASNIDLGAYSDAARGERRSIYAAIWRLESREPEATP